MSIHPKDVFDAIKAFLVDPWEKNPAAAPAVQTEQISVGQAASDVEVDGAAIISGLADQAVNYVLGLASGGSSLDSFADSLIDTAIAGLTARKSAVARTPRPRPFGGRQRPVSLLVGVHVAGGREGGRICDCLVYRRRVSLALVLTWRLGDTELRQ